MALAVHQRDGHAVDLGLYPDILAHAQPADGLFIQQFSRPVWTIGCGTVPRALASGLSVVAAEGEALAPVRQALAGLVVELIADGRMALAMVAVVPQAICSARVWTCDLASSGHSSANETH
jgi:hypothetical protein